MMRKFTFLVLVVGMASGCTVKKSETSSHTSTSPDDFQTTSTSPSTPTWNLPVTSPSTVPTQSKEPFRYDEKIRKCRGYNYGVLGECGRVSNQEFRGVNLKGKSLRGSRLSNVVLAQADLSGADLTEAVITSSDLTGVNLTDAVLENTELTLNTMNGANMKGAEMILGIFTPLSAVGLNLEGAELLGVTTHFTYSREGWHGAVVNGDTILLFMTYSKTFITPHVYEVSDDTGVVISSDLPAKMQEKLKFKKGVGQSAQSLIKSIFSRLNQIKIDSKHSFFKSDMGKQYTKIFGTQGVEDLLEYMLPRFGHLGAETREVPSTTTHAFNDSLKKWESNLADWYNSMIARLTSPEKKEALVDFPTFEPSVNVSMAMLKFDGKSLVRASTLAHEARHSDCQVSPTDFDSLKNQMTAFTVSARAFEKQVINPDLTVYTLARNIKKQMEDLVDRLTKSCTAKHSVCKTGDFAGQKGCDDSPFGAYAVDGMVSRVLRENCTDCSEKEIQALLANSTDALSRVELKSGKTLEQMWQGEAGVSYFVPIQKLFD